MTTLLVNSAGRKKPGGPVAGLSCTSWDWLIPEELGLVGLEEWGYKGYLDLIGNSQSNDAVYAIFNPHGGVCMGFNVFWGSTGHVSRTSKAWAILGALTFFTAPPQCPSLSAWLRTPRAVA